MALSDFTHIGFHNFDASEADILCLDLWLRVSISFSNQISLDLLYSLSISLTYIQLYCGISYNLLSIIAKIQTYLYLYELLKCQLPKLQFHETISIGNVKQSFDITITPWLSLWIFVSLTQFDWRYCMVQRIESIVWYLQQVKKTTQKPSDVYLYVTDKKIYEPISALVH